MIITTQRVLDLRPCAAWSRERIAAIVGDGVTPMQIATDERITISDRRWVLTRLCATLPDGQQRLVLWAASCAQDVAHLAADEDAARCAISVAIALATGCASADDTITATTTAVDATYVAAAAAAAATTAVAAAYAAAVAVAGIAAEAAAYAAAACATFTQKHLLDLATAMEDDRPRARGRIAG